MCIGCALARSGPVDTEQLMGTEVALDIVEDGSDSERLDQLALVLRQEILELDVESVSARTDGEAPPGTRGIDVAAAGALMVSLAPTVSAIGALMTTVLNWLQRGNSSRSVKIKIGDDELELTGASSEVQRYLVDEWVRRHAGAPGDKLGTV
jgi:hypothetical protein